MVRIPDRSVSVTATTRRGAKHRADSVSGWFRRGTVYSSAPVRNSRRLRTALGAGLVVGMTVVACSASDETQGSPQVGTVTLNSARQAGAGQGQHHVPAYWAGSGPQSQKLFRETLLVNGTTSGDPIETAVLAMTQARPADPDYRSLWSPVTRVGTSFTGETITLDLPAMAVAQPMEQSQARLAIQQLTHTAVAAAQDSGLTSQGAVPRVQILVDGQANQRVFGSYDLPNEETAEVSVLAPLSLDQPPREPTAGQVRLTGRVDSGLKDATLTLTRLDNAPGDDGEVLRTENVEPDPQPEDDHAETFTVQVDVSEGRYLVSLSAQNADGHTITDDHEFTVGSSQDQITADG